ncbi:unnamed protein product [Prorocentrum cordatum]|uniref:Pentatricopeptide repeat-containing protein, chloroplastic n=1 Tax=Prorocentrum cordatum TaxID=2364126 RepID=A0ABN9PJE7_9DINO|nr:unnamed protein product [Polarella glacialis]
MRDLKVEADIITYSAGISACERAGQWQRSLVLLSEMSWAKLAPNVIFFSYNAGISACEKGAQWQWALALLREMREAKLDPNTISYSAGTSACEKGGEWQRALAILSEIWESKLEPNVISYSAGISACGKGQQWQRALAMLSEMKEAKLEPNAIYLQRWDQRVREGRAVAVGAGAAQRDVRGEGGTQRLSYHVGIGACEKANCLCPEGWFLPRPSRGGLPRSAMAIASPAA